MMKEPKKKNPPVLNEQKLKKVDKEKVKKLTDEELNKAAGGLWCPPGFEYINNGCHLVDDD